MGIILQLLLQPLLLLRLLLLLILIVVVLVKVSQMTVRLSQVTLSWLMLTFFILTRHFCQFYERQKRKIWIEDCGERLFKEHLSYGRHLVFRIQLRFYGYDVMYCHQLKINGTQPVAFCLQPASPLPLILSPPCSSSYPPSSSSSSVNRC